MTKELHGVVDVNTCNLLFHQKCYDVYTHSKSLKIISEKRNSDVNTVTDSGDNERRASSRKRDRKGNIYYFSS